MASGLGRLCRCGGGPGSVLLAVFLVRGDVDDGDRELLLGSEGCVELIVVLGNDACLFACHLDGLEEKTV